MKPAYDYDSVGAFGFPGAEGGIPGAGIFRAPGAPGAPGAEGLPGAPGEPAIPNGLSGSCAPHSEQTVAEASFSLPH